MAASDNLVAAAMEPWVFRSGFGDSWFSDVFSHENEVLTKVFQRTLSDAPPPPEVFPAMVFKVPEVTQTTTTVSGGSENETAASKRRRVGQNGGDKCKKRKSRAAKRATTTFITADAAHFRQMVQEVTGLKFPGGNFPHAPPLPSSSPAVLKPEPTRASVLRLQQSACLPTLDTSAFLLDQTKQSSLHAPPPPPYAPPKMEEEDCGDAAFDLDFFASFPTLESWKTVMQ